MQEYKATLEEENKEIAKRYKDLLKGTYITLSHSDKLMIRKAFNLAVEAHSEQRRKSGEPYILNYILEMNSDINYCHTTNFLFWKLKKKNIISNHVVLWNFTHRF